MNDIPASKRGIGFVFQNYALFRYMTIYDNVAFGLELQKMPKKLIKERVTKLLEMTGLSGLEKRYPNQDVYKRQVDGIAEYMDRYGVKDISELVGAVDRESIMDRPVSYTHLDVYKRQIC